MNITVLQEKVARFVPVMQHDTFVLEAIKEALCAAERGNFGIGAVLVNETTGQIICRGQNKVFSHSRSDLHAEMDLINNFEAKYGEKSREMLKELTLFSSLESCPMCLCRIITAGIPRVHHIADDRLGGMVHLYHNLPPVWQEISAGRLYKKADCSEELSQIAEQAFLATLALNDKLL